MKLRNDEELIINKVKKEDAKEMIEYLNLIGGESDNLTFGENGFNRSLEEEQNFIEELSKAKTSALLVGRINDEIVCTASIISPTKERLAHQCTIGMSVKKKYWNNGIATYLLSEVISFARENG
ncbi:MAG: GNAT family N-acetyltransferase, partial [Oscillospiraceae bacterium]|nr:GNAT family N-acetyltransferase [Oscillospiraceae bacterium]